MNGEEATFVQLSRASCRPHEDSLFGDCTGQASGEVIPRQLCENAGFDATDVLNKLRQKHASGEGANYGVDINTGGITDSFANFVWEPSVVKINAINAATEAACLILSVDETVKNPKSESAQGEAAASAMAGRSRGPPFGGRGGRGMRRR